MSRRLTLRPKAEQDLEEIWDFTVATWSLARAEAYLGGLQQVFDLLCVHPDMAKPQEGLSPPVRLHPYRLHLVIFATDEAVLEVIRVVHMRSNWQGVVHG